MSKGASRLPATSGGSMLLQPSQTSTKSLPAGEAEICVAICELPMPGRQTVARALVVGVERRVHELLEQLGGLAGPFSLAMKSGGITVWWVWGRPCPCRAGAAQPPRAAPAASQRPVRSARRCPSAAILLSPPSG